MSTKVEIIASGQTFDLSDRITRFHRGNTGLGLPPLQRYTERGALQDGDTDAGFALEPRIVQLKLRIDAEDEADFFAQRDELCFIFAPRVNPIQLRLTRADGKVRQLDVHYAGGLELPTTERVGYIFEPTVRLIANNPTAYDPELRSLSAGLSLGGSFSVPLAVPMSVGSSTLNNTITVVYGGNYSSYPLVRVYGPLTDFRIENLATQQHLQVVTGTSIAGGTYWDFSPKYGRPTVVDSAGVDRMTSVSDDSDLTTFQIAGTTEVTNGANDFLITGTGGNTSTQVYLVYYERFLHW